MSRLGRSRDREVFATSLWDEPRRPRLEERVQFCVLASSSRGNCSILVHRLGDDASLHRITLIDAGLAPRRTRRVLADLGLDFDRIDQVILTHLDQDHCRPTWRRFLPPHACFRVHRRHMKRARRLGLTDRRVETFDDETFPLKSGVDVTPVVLRHDELGVAAFRFDFDDGAGSSLGYATDLGRVTHELTDAFSEVDILAIESNYCPRMQAASDRPDFLKTRITGGRGHISNEECRDAVLAIRPRRHVVLLHLSLDCNQPEIAAGFHAESACPVTLAMHDRPTPVVNVAGYA